MPSRTIKGAIFTIIVGEKRITVKHVAGKGKRCRVILPRGVLIESGAESPESPTGRPRQETSSQ